jgi:hypothetical protein
VVEEAEEHEMTTDSNEAVAQSSILPKIFATIWMP